MELVCILVNLLSKWFKTSSYRKMRRIGYIIAAPILLVWVFYFFSFGQHYLAAYSVMNFFTALRGIKNNLKVHEISETYKK